MRDTDGDGNIDYPEATTEIENGAHQLETLLEATVDKTFDKFEIYTLRNILTVPDELAGWMRLGHYEVSDRNTSCSFTRMLFRTMELEIRASVLLLIPSL